MYSACSHAILHNPRNHKVLAWSGIQVMPALGYITCLEIYHPIKRQHLFPLMKNEAMSFALLFVRLAVKLNVTEHLNTSACKNIFSANSATRIEIVYSQMTNVGIVVPIRYQDCPQLNDC